MVMEFRLTSTLRTVPLTPSSFLVSFSGSAPASNPAAAIPNNILPTIRLTSVLHFTPPHGRACPAHHLGLDELEIIVGGFGRRMSREMQKGVKDLPARWQWRSLSRYAQREESRRGRGSFQYDRH